MGMNVSDTLAGTFKLKSGAAIAINDAVEIGPDGRGYPAICTDYAAVSNCTYGTAQTSKATGRIIADTTAWGYTNNTTAREPVVVDDKGKIWVLIPTSTTTGMTIQIYTAAGILVQTIPVESTGATYSDKQIILLANGNICVAGFTSSQVDYQVFSDSGTAVCAFTTIANRSGSFRMCALAAGGFAVLSRYLGDGASYQLSTYDNSGTQVLALTTFFTAATAATGYPNIAQLSNGNLAVATYVANGTVGLCTGVITTSGVVVTAVAQLNATISSTPTPAISVLTGYFCVGYSNGATSRAAVFNNAGVLQGGEFSVSSSGIAAVQNFDLVNDGTQFWFVTMTNTGTKEIAVKVPVTGTGFVTTNVTLTSAYNYNSPLSCKYAGGRIVCVSHYTSTAPILWVIDAATGLLISTADTSIGTSATGAGSTGHLLDAGDFAFIWFGRYGDATLHLIAGKFANTSVVGVAASPAAVNDYANMCQAAGTYPVNTLKGSPAVAFDHTTGSTIAGNKGTILTNGLVLRGM